ncbi:glycosyltransferase family 1 protein [Subtercola sp. Z020]|nr:glycosyltransferase family 1 protein [Subtercola sp. Z020]
MAASRPIVVNGAFRPQAVSGQQRYAREIADRLVGEAGVTEASPSGWFARSALRTWAWVFGVLPIRRRSDVLVTLTSRGPLAHPRQVVVVHDLFVITNPEWYSRKYVLSHAPLLKAQLRSAKTVAVVSEPVARQVAESGLTRARIVVAPNAPSAQFLDAPDAVDQPLLGRLGITADRFLLAVGNLDPRKNFDRLARAFASLDPAVRAECPLVVVGGVNATVFASVGIEWPTETILAGYVSDPELAALYRSARGVVFPSLAEGFGLPMVEAAVSGARLSVSDIGVFRWIAGDAVSYFDPTSVEAIAGALLGLIEADDDIDESFGADIRARFDWDQSAATISEASRRVASQ